MISRCSKEPAASSRAGGESLFLLTAASLCIGQSASRDDFAANAMIEASSSSFKVPEATCIFRFSRATSSSLRIDEIVSLLTITLKN